MGIAFGELVPRRECHGDGKRHRKMDPQEQRERDHQLRAAKRTGDDPPPLLCTGCDGKGYVKP